MYKQLKDRPSRARIVVGLALAVLVGCDSTTTIPGGTGSGGQDMAGVKAGGDMAQGGGGGGCVGAIVGSCTNPHGGDCTDYQDLPSGAQPSYLCDNGNILSNSACDRTNSVGGCRDFSIGCQTRWSYPPKTLADVTQQCILGTVVTP